MKKKVKKHQSEPGTDSVERSKYWLPPGIDVDLTFAAMTFIDKNGRQIRDAFMYTGAKVSTEGGFWRLGIDDSDLASDIAAAIDSVIERHSARKDGRHNAESAVAVGGKESKGDDSQDSLVYGRFDSKKEKESYDSFCKRHSKCRKSQLKGQERCAVPVVDAPYVMEKPTSIGVIRKVVCPICGKSKDITDLEAW